MTLNKLIQQYKKLLFDKKLSVQDKAPIQKVLNDLLLCKAREKAAKK